MLIPFRLRCTHIFERVGRDTNDCRCDALHEYYLYSESANLGFFNSVSGYLREAMERKGLQIVCERPQDVEVMFCRCVLQRTVDIDQFASMRVGDGGGGALKVYSFPGGLPMCLSMQSSYVSAPTLS